jgi:hypothetical protein
MWEAIQLVVECTLATRKYVANQLWAMKDKLKEGSIAVVQRVVILRGRAQENGMRSDGSRGKGEFVNRSEE